MNLYAGQALQGIFFSFVTEMKRNKRKVQKRPELGGRKSDFRNHSKNSLCSNSFSCRFTCLAISDTRIEEDSENSTFSKDLLVRNVFEENMKHEVRLRALLAWLVQALGYAACYRRDARMFLNFPTGRAMFFK